MLRVRKLSQPRGWAFVVAASVMKPILYAAGSRDWSGGLKIPAKGGCLVVFNHISHFDPFTAGHFVYDHGRLPRYLAKSEVFKNPVIGWFLRSAGQIPVQRMTQNAAQAFDAAVAAIKSGECIVVYPEGTLTRDPNLWPMQAKTGAARLALETRCPVIPVGQWGAQDFLAPYAAIPKPFPRKRFVLRAGDQVDLSDLYDQPRTPEVVAEASERIMDALTGLVGEIRDETPPAERFDPRKAGVKQIGNPNKPDRKRGRS